MKADWFRCTWMVGLMVMMLSGCGSSEIKPVDIFSEDICSNCRMSISDRAFSSEIIDDQGGVFKFDDLGCLESFKTKYPAMKIRALFVTDYNSKSWMPYEKSTIIQTGIKTPMGSGKLVFLDTSAAKEFADKYPPDTKITSSCCVKEGE